MIHDRCIDREEVRRAVIKGIASLEYIERNRGIYILSVCVNKSHRQKGYATRLLTYIFGKGKPITYGKWSKEGRKYLKPIVERLRK